jgi:PAS domain S-box-containing protein
MDRFELIAYPLLPISAMELLLGFLLLTQHRRSSPVHRSVAAIAFFSSAYSLNTAVMYLTASHGHDYIFFARLNWIGWFALPAGLQFLYYLRPEASRTARMVGYVLYPYWAVVLTLCLFTDLIVTPQYSLIPYVNHPGPLEIPARVCGALMTLWTIVEIMRIRRHLTGIKKFQLDHFFYGLLLFASGGVMIAGIMPAIGGFGVEPGLGSYFSLPWVVLTFYAIVRHSLFEMRIIFSKTLSILILILVCSGIQAVIHAAIEPAFGTVLSLVISLAFLGFFLFGTGVSRILQSFVNSLIIGDRYNYESLTREAIVTLNAKHNGQELIDYLIETTCSGLNVRDAGIYVHAVEDGFVMRQGRGRFLDMKDRRTLADIAVTKLHETNRSLILKEIAGAGEEREPFYLSTYMRGIGAEALVPLLFQGRLQGVLVLGAKVSGEMFGQSDVGFLETLAAHAASGLENARLNDITRKVRSSLQESEERFTTLAQKMPAAVFIHRGASIVYANNAAEEMTGYSQERLMTMHIRDVLLPENRGAIQPNGLERAEPPLRYAEKEVRVPRLNGSERWAVMTSSVIEYGERAAVIWIFFDITEHKGHEGKLRYERIRDAVGRMATYVAGDLDGMVKDIRRVTELHEQGEEGDSSSELAQKIMSTMQQAEILVRTLKEISTRQETKRTLQDMGELVGKSQQILAAMLSGTCELVMRSSPEPLKVLADPIKLESALMNLVVNARDQMPRGGVVTVATGRALIDADYIRRNGYGRVGAYATVSVSDTGEGMGAAEQERIFEPFFMTRGDRKESGIGLSMVYDIIKEHEGYITVTSLPGQGCSCMAYFPLLP